MWRTTGFAPVLSAMTTLPPELSGSPVVPLDPRQVVTPVATSSAGANMLMEGGVAQAPDRRRPEDDPRSERHPT